MIDKNQWPSFHRSATFVVSLDYIFFRFVTDAKDINGDFESLSFFDESIFSP